MKFLHYMLLLVVAALCGSRLTAQEERPVRDDVGFCWTLDGMTRLVHHLDSIESEKPFDGTVVAGISPHDDFLYAGRVDFPLHRIIRAREAVIFGVTHGTVRKEIGDPKNILMLDSFPVWKGIRGPVPVSPLREFIASRLDTSFFRINPKAHRLEHSIEALLPWLQYYNPGITITPIMVTAMPFGRMDTISAQLSSIYAEYIKQKSLVPGRDIVFLMSCDANHYGEDFNNVPFGTGWDAHAKGTGQDIRLATEDCTGRVTPDKIRHLTEKLASIVWCGKYSVPMGLLTSEKTIEKVLQKHLTGTLLRYSDTATEGVLPVKGTGMGTTAPFSFRHWVGFFSAGFTLE
jgi:MEMO1 family protein